MNVLLWIVVLASGAVLGASFAGSVTGITLSSLSGAALFPFAAALIRLAIWMVSRVR